ncbi:SGNH/GDSL hydrolase family protein [Hoeflea olei]|uniref:G-D-S-L family lipolytic protein n=1 Tax=Hoeflea olei TaxID=1480615 RepID=A0A1C1Z0V5_9HYPH|nr:SGNH/GDSL hydrolase family protein [Hoeflea olei]OCW59330.1 G-D-S-L family lipolytic protein [Hoeflea olei]
MNSLLAGALSWLLLPIALVEGMRVRRAAPRLPPPRGRPKGVVGTGEAAIRLLVLGDSSAAGVGADRIADTLGPQLAACLHEQTGKTVSWRNAGANSATAAQVRDFVVPHVAERDFTHVLIAVGTNDAKNFVTRSAFKKGFGGLLYAVHARWPEAQVYWSQVIAMEHVPALPPRLAFILGLRRDIINAVGRQLCRERYGEALAPLAVLGPEGFATDGFHANAEGYRYWAEHVTRAIGKDEPMGDEQASPDAAPASSSSQRRG